MRESGKNRTFAPNMRLLFLLLWTLGCTATLAQKDYYLGMIGESAGIPSGILQILQDHNGLLWAATYNGLYRYDGYEWRNYKSHSGDGTRLKTNHIKHLYLSSQGNLWCLIDNHAILFDMKTYRFVDILANYEQQSKRPLEVTKIRTLQNGSTWFITEDGLLLTTANDGAAKIRIVMKGVSDKDTNISDDAAGTTWICMPKAVYADRGHGAEKRTPQDYARRATDGGASKQQQQLSTDSQKFQHFPLPHSVKLRHGLKDRQGRIWLSDTDSDCLMLFSPDWTLMGYLAADGTLDMHQKPFGAKVYSMLQDSRGNYWLGTGADGLYRLKEVSHGVFQTDHFTTANSTLGDDKIYDLKEDRQGRIWIATDKSGPNCMPQPQAPKPDFVHGSLGLKGYLSEYCQKCYAVLPTHSGHLLVGTAEGLYVADISGQRLANTRFVEHQREAFREQSLGCSNVGSLAETVDHRLFAGTQGGGVDEIVSNNLSGLQLDFRHYQVANGFPTDMPQSLFAGSDSTLWVVSNCQLIELRYRDQPFTCNAYMERANQQFSKMKPIQLAEGQWLLGVADGAVVVTLNDLKQISYIPPIVVTDVAIEGRNALHIPQATDTIILSPGERNVTITFAALDYNGNRALNYAFRMNNNPAWNYIGSGGHSVSMANLEPAIYHLQIRSTNSDGQWMDNAHDIIIIVKPTFWQTGWAKMLIGVIILTIATVIAYTLLYIKRIKRQQRETMEAYLAMNATPHSDQGSEKLSPEDQDFMNRLMAYIEKNIGNSDASPEEMANATATSRSSLNRKVNRILGMTPMEFMREARIRKAFQLLHEGTLTINDIAYACGFTDPKYFSKCFKQVTGKTPKQYKDDL